MQILQLGHIYLPNDCSQNGF